MDNETGSNLKNNAAKNVGKYPSLIAVARLLFLLNAIVWFIFGVWSMAKISAMNYAWVLALLMFTNAAVMLWLGWGIKKQHKGYYFLAIAVVAVNVILTMTDEFGLLDFFVLVIDLVLFAILIVTKAYYLSANEKSRSYWSRFGSNSNE